VSCVAYVGHTPGRRNDRPLGSCLHGKGLCLGVRGYCSQRFRVYFYLPTGMIGTCFNVFNKPLKLAILWVHISLA